MSDVFIIHGPADKPAAEALRAALAALDVDVAGDIAEKPKTAELKRAVKAVRAARVLVVLRSQAAADGGLSAAVRARLAKAEEKSLAVALDPAAAGAPLGAFLKDAGRRGDDPAWLGFLDLIGPRIGRPALAALARAVEADRGRDDQPAQEAFARSHPDDPMAPAIWSRVEQRERERFAETFRAAHAAVDQRRQAAHGKLRECLEGFAVSLRERRIRTDTRLPDPMAAIDDGLAALAARAALSAQADKLAEERDAARAAAGLAAAQASRSRIRWLAASAAALLLGAVGAGVLVEALGPLRGEAHPRIAAALRHGAQAQASGRAEAARLSQALEAAAARAQAAESSLSGAEAALAKARAATARHAADQEAARAAEAAAQGLLREAADRAQKAEQELAALRAAQTAAAPPAPAPEITGSIPPPPPASAEGPYRHRGERWSFAVAPGFRVESDNDLPGPVNTVLLREGDRDAVVVVSANDARRICSAQGWYAETVIDGPRPRRGRVLDDAALPRQAGFSGFWVRGSGVLHGDRFRPDLDFYDIVARHRGEPGVVYLIQARFPRARAPEMIRAVNEMWKSFALTGPRAYPTRC